jgi:hypothetical protein
MRQSLFLSTLFAVSMVGGVALAEKPQGATGREPRVVEQPRSHGDTVDKVYRAPAADRSGAASRAHPAVETTAKPPNAKNPLDRSASRINCADTDPNCGAMHSSTQRAESTGRAETSNGRYNVRPPAFLDKILGSDRTNFNEAGEDEGMSVRAANRVWSHAGQSGTAKASTTLADKTQVDRKQRQYQSSRVSCNEGDACSASSKDTKKEWAYAAIKAGTWTGPEKQVSIAADRAAESASLHDEKVAHSEADHAHGHGSAASAPHQGEEH